MNMKTKLRDINLLDVGNTLQMVGAIYGDKNSTYLCLFPEDRPANGETLPGIEVLDMDQDDWVKFLRQTDVMETEVLAKAPDKSLVKAIARKSQRQIDQNVSWRVFRRDSYKCRYCGKDDVPLTVDHLVRWEEGGPSTEANLLTADRKCNRTRGDMSYADWLQSDYYARVSAGLDQATKNANEALVATLAAIPRVINIKSR